MPTLPHRSPRAAATPALHRRRARGTSARLTTLKALAPLAALAAFAAAPLASAFADNPDAPPAPPRHALAPEPGTPAAYEHKQAQKRLADAEAELKIIRSKHFLTRNVEQRQVGTAKIRTFTDPATFPALLSVFDGDDRTVRMVVLDHLTDLASDEADATLAWAAIHDRENWFRTEAAQRLAKRVKTAGAISNRVKWSVAAGLRSNREKPMARAAQLARDLRMYDAIPQLINLQVGGGPAGGGGGGANPGAGSTYFVGDPGTSLADLLVGTQTAFVADLDPVVGDNAVAFDPQLAVATEGTVLRVIDAVVVTYRVEIHNALIAIADAGWDGRSTARLGWDQRKWAIWYANEFVPHRRRVEAAANTTASPNPSP